MAEGKKKERTTVSIYGQEYTIIGDEKPGHIIEVAKMVDEKMKEIRKMNPYLDTTKLAVLTAINIVDQHIKLEKELTELRGKVEKEETDPDA